MRKQMKKRGHVNDVAAARPTLTVSKPLSLSESEARLAHMEKFVRLQTMARMHFEVHPPIPNTFPLHTPTGAMVDRLNNCPHTEEVASLLIAVCDMIASTPIKLQESYRLEVYFRPDSASRITITAQIKSETRIEGHWEMQLDLKNTLPLSSTLLPCPPTRDVKYH